MKQNQLRLPLISSAVILLIISLLVYFTLTTPEGSVVGSVGSIVLLIIRTAQTAIGLALGLIICLAVLTGIFLGAIALVSGAAASKMYEGLRQNILCWLAPLAGLFKSNDGEKLQAELTAFGDTMKADFTRFIAPVRRELATIEEAIESKVKTLRGQLSEVENTIDDKASAEQLATVTAEVSSVSETLSGTEASIKTLEAKVEQAVQQAGAVDAEKILGDVPTRLETLEQQEAPAPVDLQPLEEKISGLQAEMNKVIKPLEKKIAALTAEIDVLKTARAQQPVAEKPAVQGKAAAPTKKKEIKKAEVKTAPEPDSEHRLLSYFAQKEDKKKLEDLVAQTLKKDMTYAQVTKFLVKEMGKEGGKIISEHPSLAKDYIRQCRRKA
ncbi:MAG TPA: hypothetical protein ENK96_03890 [Desulfobulbaceae bacterium]|nr:hypothetical protein [Desulfobulbaceae bacterium]